jgi:hypothetical protein
MITKANAVLALKPNAIWTMRGDVLEWQDDNITAPTDSQITAKYDELVAAEPLNLVREVRNQKLAETDWVVTMHKELGTNIPAAMKTYRAALRDITDSATSLDDVTWPEKP